jgi:hypothetical protein
MARELRRRDGSEESWWELNEKKNALDYLEMAVHYSNEPPMVCPDSCKMMTCFRDKKETGRNSNKLV